MHQQDAVDDVAPLLITSRTSTSLRHSKPKRGSSRRCRTQSDSNGMNLDQNDLSSLPPTPRKKPSVTSDQRRHRGNPAELRTLSRFSRSLDSLMSTSKDIGEVRYGKCQSVSDTYPLFSNLYIHAFFKFFYP